MVYDLVYSSKFLEKAPKLQPAALREAIRNLVRQIATDPRGVGRPGLLPALRFAAVGYGAWHLAWIVCEECFELDSQERAQEPCAACESRSEGIVRDAFVPL